ncbi:MAG: L,D-transpeptidase [Anaerolineales bacterium]
MTEIQRKWVNLNPLLVLLGIVLAVGGELLLAPSAHAAGPMDDVLCTGRMQARHLDRCAPQGPGAALAARSDGSAENPMPLPTRSIDPSLYHLPFNYIRLDSSGPTRLFLSPQDAREGKNASAQIDSGFTYVSWMDCQIIDGKAIYMVEPGVYIRGGSNCSQIGTSDFQGLSFYRTPNQPFAWVLGGSYTVSEPGTEQYTSRWVYRYELVWIYEETKIGDWTWYRIGPNDWVEQRLLSVVRPDGTKPEGVEGDRWISIDLHEQTVSAYENGELVYATIASTGLRGWWTQPGTFQVYAKLETDTMSGAFEADRSDYYYLQDVPWVLYYDQARAIHGAYWHNGYGYPRSHGCVNLSLTDSHWFFNWAEEGTWVHVYDPTGETPTDEELYGAGGA